MRELNLTKTEKTPLQVLLIGAHCDDIEIGCGGTVLALSESYPNLSVYWVVLSSDRERAREAQSCAEGFLKRVPEVKIAIESFRDGYFPYEGGHIKDYFEALKKTVSPDVIFTHHRDDWHQDHRIVCELTWNTWRDHLILEYEVPKYDPDVGSPNVFVQLSEGRADAKIRHIMEAYSSQASRDWFSPDTFRSLMRLRGMESRSPSRLAEAFYARKLVLSAR